MRQKHFHNVDLIGNPRYGNVGRMVLPIKSIDTLQPVYGVLAFVTLIGLVFCGHRLDPILIRIILAKLSVDLVFHFWSIRLYCRWQRIPSGLAIWISAALVTLTEPITFQLLRHVGAVWGWLSAFRSRDEWTPARRDLNTQPIGN